MTTRSAIGIDPDAIMRRFRDPALESVGKKLFAGSRLSLQEGLTCMQTTDLLGLGSLALAAKRARFGDRAFYVVNQHLNYTNVCTNACRFCAFHRAPGSEEGYLMSPEQAAASIAPSRDNGLKEVHVVGGLHPDPDFTYYLELLRALKKAAPNIGIKAFTAVEIDHIARRAGISWAECLTALKEEGLNALPGGGAEVFSERVREELFPSKISAETWLAVHGTAHRLGIGSNATLLFGHIETPEERVEHLLRLRTQQDETGGFRAFIPLAFQSRTTRMAKVPGPTGVDILKTIAVSRLMLDNIPHVKAYWVMLGPKMAQIALHFGADDVEGTIVKEQIAHEAGATTAPGLTRDEMIDMIVRAGFEPAERDTFHKPVGAP
jgi:aminodeoxyfutalosine synthase